jgi:hypothetical protein
VYYNFGRGFVCWVGMKIGYFVLTGLAFILLVTEFAKHKQLDAVNPESLRSRGTVPNRDALVTKVPRDLLFQKHATSKRFGIALGAPREG